MAIRLKCDCGEIFSVPDEFVGKKGKCPECGKIIPVPETTDSEIKQFAAKSDGENIEEKDDLLEDRDIPVAEPDDDVFELTEDMAVDADDMPDEPKKKIPRNKPAPGKKSGPAPRPARKKKPTAAVALKKGKGRPSRKKPPAKAGADDDYEDDYDEYAPRPKNRMPLYIGAGVGAVVVLIIIVFLLAGGHAEDQALKNRVWNFLDTYSEGNVGKAVQYVHPDARNGGTPGEVLGRILGGSPEGDYRYKTMRLSASGMTAYVYIARGGREIKTVWTYTDRDHTWWLAGKGK